MDTVADQGLAQQVEEQGAVLLKNAGGQLPLNAAMVASIAVIGSHADVGVLSSELIKLYHGEAGTPAIGGIVNSLPTTSSELHA